MILSHSNDLAIQALSKVIKKKPGQFPSIQGPKKVVESFIEHYYEEPLQKIRVEQQGFYILKKVVMPNSLKGRLRIADSSQNTEIILEWRNGFERDVGFQASDKDIALE